MQGLQVGGPKMIPLLIASAFGLHLWGARAPAVERHRLDQWTYELHHDAFTGKLTCNLESRNISILHGAAVFRFGNGVDTSDAVFRVDDGPAESARALALDLLHRGVSVQDEALANPSRGLVMIPVERLEQAREVTIRPSVGARPRKFLVVGLKAALAAAQSSGCDPVGSYR